MERASIMIITIIEDNLSYELVWPSLECWLHGSALT